MVRNIVGALVHVGAGKDNAAWLAGLARRARPHARRTHVRRRRAVSRRRGLRCAVRAAADGARGDARGAVVQMSTMRTRIKICGITRVADALAAAEAGADAIGLVFWPGTPRCVETARAREIADALPPFVTKVALFVDPDPADVRSVLDAVPIDVLQFHGDEPRELCSAFARPYLKAVHMRGRRRFARIRGALRRRVGIPVRHVPRRRSCPAAPGTRSTGRACRRRCARPCPRR